MIKYRHKVVLYPANLVTYLRALCLLLMLVFAFKRPVIAWSVGVVAQGLDMFDGWLAKRTGISHYGAVLDMLVDRIGYAVVLIVLMHLYPNWFIVFCLAIILDMGSHFILVYASALLGVGHHKDFFVGCRHPLLHWYYSANRTFMVWVHMGLGLFLSGLYLAYFFSGTVWYFLIVPGGVMACIYCYILLLQAVKVLSQVIAQDQIRAERTE